MESLIRWDPSQGTRTVMLHEYSLQGLKAVVFQITNWRHHLSYYPDSAWRQIALASTAKSIDLLRGVMVSTDPNSRIELQRSFIIAFELATRAMRSVEIHPK
jgi:hypothetical protein